MKAPPVEEVADPLVSTTDDAAIQTLRHRAAASALLVGARGFLIKGIALAGTLAFARLLRPADFGLIAIGTVFIAAGKVLSDAGLGPGLIRRAEPPLPQELGCVLGYGLGVAGVIVAVAAVLALTLGRLGGICFVMALSVPFAVLRSPGVIECERSLDYSPLVVAEIGEVLAYNLWGLGAVLAGFGVWGLASAAITQTVVGSGLVIARSGTAMPAPNVDRALLRPLLGFGLRYQAVPLILLARDQGLNLGTAIIDGVSTLGIWNLAFRIMQVPFLVIEALWRVSYPAMARLREAGDDLRVVVERTAGLTAVAAVTFLAPLAASAHALIPALFGERWDAAAPVAVYSSIGLAVAGPISVASGGYLYAAGEAGTVLRGIVLMTLAWAAVAFSLLAPLGVSALGIGWLVASLVEAAGLGMPASRLTGARVLTPILPALGSGAIAGFGGWLAASSLPQTLLAGLAIAGATLAAYIAVLRIIGPSAFRDAVRALLALRRQPAA